MMQLKKDTVIIKIYSFEHQAAAAIFNNLEGKLRASNVDPKNSLVVE